MTARTIKRMRLRRTDTCTECGEALAVGEPAGWCRDERSVTCLPCLDGAATDAKPVPEEASAEAAGPEPEVNQPGASLEKEYERRVAARDKRVRERHPRIGGFLLAVTPEPATTKAFARGAEGERRVAARLEKACGDTVLFLHNRRRGAGLRSGDIDHLAVAPSGVWVIDAKHYENAEVEVRVTGGFRGPRREQLMVRGRDRTCLVESLQRQHAAVGEVLASCDVPVHAAFCFIDSLLPWIGTPTIQGYPVLGPRGTSKRLRGHGPLDQSRRLEVWQMLARTFPPA